MGFVDAISTCLRKYASFSGRASRPEYWFFFLFTVLVSIIASVVDGLLAPAPSGDGVETSARMVQNITGLALFLPHLAAGFRRMQDTGRPGWFVLLPTGLMLAAGFVLVFGIGLADQFTSGGSWDVLLTRATLLVVIPTLIVLLISPLLVLFWLSRPSDAGDNRYGPKPVEAYE